MKFRLGTVLWGFALLASAMATFGVFGGPYGLLVLSFWGYVFHRKKPLFGPTFLLAHCFLLVVTILMWLEPVRRSSPRNSCLNNMKQIALAIQNYEMTHRALPPPYTTDDNGQPLHSWRVLLLPYLEENNLYKAINLDEPWDSPYNRQWWDKMPDVYSCVGCLSACRMNVLEKEKYSTSYFAVVGPGTVWSEGMPKESNRTFGDDETLLFIEAYRPDICWMEPRDLSIKETIQLLCSDRAVGHLSVIDKLLATTVNASGHNLAFTDGHAFGTSGKLFEADARNLIQRENKEEVDWDRTRNHHWFQIAKVYKWKLIYSFCIFVLLSLMPIVKLRQ